MSEATQHLESSKAKPKRIEVKVSFPLGGKRPYTEKLAPETTADAVRLAAMDYFGVADDQTETYYLALGGQRVDAGATVGSLAGRTRELKFTLAKELIQG